MNDALKQQLLAAAHAMQDEILRFLDVDPNVPQAVRDRWDAEFLDALAKERKA